MRPDASRGNNDEALTPADGTGDEDFDPGLIRLVLVEPRAIQGAAVREMLEREDDFEVVASVRTTEEAADLSADEAPDILVVDVDLPDPAAVEATRQLRRQAPNSALVIIGGEDDDEAVFRAVQAGASAHVADDDGPSELVDAIRRVAEGEDPLIETVAERPALAQRVAGAYRELAIRGAARPERKGRVSPRQLEILRLVAKGMSNEEIALRLHISRQTVKNHMTVRDADARRATPRAGGRGSHACRLAHDLLELRCTSCVGGCSPSEQSVGSFVALLATRAAPHLLRTTTVRENQFGDPDAIPVEHDHPGVPKPRRPWTSEVSSSERVAAIMTPSPCLPAMPSRGWTGPPASSSGTRSSRATRSRRRSSEPGATFRCCATPTGSTPGSIA